MYDTAEEVQCFHVALHLSCCRPTLALGFPYYGFEYRWQQDI